MIYESEKKKQEQDPSRGPEHLLEGQSLTQIVYKSNTNFTTIRSVIELLKEKKLIETIDGSPVLYKTSAEGMRMMDRLKMLQDELEGIIGK